MLNTLNTIFNWIFEVLFLPFRSTDPIWGILFVSVITGVLMLFIYKATSDQAGIKQAKNRVKGHFLAIRLYRDDIGVMFDTMKNILLSNLFYMRKSLRPMLFLTIPVGVVLVQLGSRYEFRPLRVGETFVLTLRLDDDRDDVDISEVALDLPDGLALTMQPVRISNLAEVNWRVRVDKSGAFTIAIRHQDREIQKTLLAADSLVPVTWARAQNDITMSLLNPHEPSLAESSFAAAISVGYPKRDIELWGMRIHWLVAFFVFSLIAAFSLKGLLRVEV